MSEGRWSEAAAHCGLEKRPTFRITVSTFHRMDDPPRLSLDHLEPSSGEPGNKRGSGRMAMHPKGRPYWTTSRKEALAAWLFILPDFIGLLIFVAIPME